MRTTAVGSLALSLGIAFLHPINAIPQGLQVQGHPPDRPWPDLPGASKGRLESHWIAPYVSVVTDFGKNTVTWFAADGHVKRTAVAESIEPGFVTLPGHGAIQEEIDGTNEDWRIELLKRAETLETSIKSTPDSRIFSLGQG